MTREIPKTEWNNFLMSLAASNRGAMVKLSAESDSEGIKMLGRYPLIAIEGDCVGDILNETKIVIGETEGENPGNVFHFVKSPTVIITEETDQGEVEKLILKNIDDKQTVMEFV